jgi:hypothetical protein
MSRTDIPEELVRKPSESAATKEWIERTCARIRPQIESTVRDALEEEARSMEAGAWVSSAEKALASLLRGGKPPGRDASALGELHQRLASAIGKDLPRPDEAEVAEHARELVAVVVTCWLDTVRQLLEQEPKAAPPSLRHPFSTQPQVSLDYDLLPGEAEHPSQRQALLAAVHPFAVGEEALLDILHAMRDEILSENQQTAKLPFGIELGPTNRASGDRARGKANGYRVWLPGGEAKDVAARVKPVRQLGGTR